VLVVSTDAHRTLELDSMRFGVDQARRGWCTASNIANTRPLEQLRGLLRRKAPATKASPRARAHAHAATR